MSTPLPSAAQFDSFRPAPAAVRRNRTNGTSSPEIYGAENLPVLIRLPDLLPSSNVSSQPEAAGPETEADLPAGAEVPQTDVVQEVSERTEELPPSRERRRRRGEQRARSPRRPVRNIQAPGWLKGLGQLALAAVLAGVLLAVIVTVKNWNTQGSKPQHPQDPPYAEAPDFDFDGPMLKPDARAFESAPEAREHDVGPPQGPDLGLPTMTRSEGMLHGVSPADMPAASSSAKFKRVLPALPALPAEANLRLAREVEVPGAARDTSVIRQPITSSYQYPLTGVEPVTTRGPAGVAVDSAAGWRETLDVSPVRNAERPSADPLYRHR